MLGRLLAREMRLECTGLLLGLPQELASALLTGGFLRPTETVVVRRVCRALRRLVESEATAPYWRRLSIARWPIYRTAVAGAEGGGSSSCGDDGGGGNSFSGVGGGGGRRSAEGAVAGTKKRKKSKAKDIATKAPKAKKPPKVKRGYPRPKEETAARRAMGDAP